MAYTLLDLRTRVRTKIKDTSYSSTTIDGFIDDAIMEIADVFPFKQFEKVVSGALTVGEYTYEQQDDHQITKGLILIDPINTDSFFDLTKYYKTWEEFKEVHPVPDAQDNAQPYCWTEYGDQIYFNCPVDKAYIIRQYYQKLPTELTADGDIPELPRNFREAIVLGAAYRCEEERQNYDIAAVLEGKFGDRVGDLIGRFANTTMVGPDTVVMPGRR